MSPPSDHRFAAFIGIDWADAKHDVCLQAVGSNKREHATLANRPQDINTWACTLRERFQGQPLAVCLEIARGPIVYALQKYDFFVLFPVNPETLAQYRKAFAPSGAKDDPTDAQLQLELLIHHRDKLRVLKPQSPAMRKLLRLVEQRRRLVGDKCRTANRLIDALKQYYPQALECFETRDTGVFCEFLIRWPTLKQAQQARRTTLERFFREHRVPSANVIARRIRMLKDTVSLTQDPAVIEPNTLLVQALVAQLQVTLRAVKRFDAEIAAVADTLPDYALFRSLPGAGAILGPRLLTAFGEQRDRYANAAEFQKCTGIAPVTERSGRKSWVHWRWQCSTFPRQSLVEWAGETISRSFWAGTYYRQQRTKGCSHPAAVRALAFKWSRVLYRCWQTRTPYDESTYLNALKRHGSPLLQQMAKAS
jgi:transposase